MKVHHSYVLHFLFEIRARLFREMAQDLRRLHAYEGRKNRRIV